MGICSSKSNTIIDDDTIKNCRLLSNYLNPILSFKNHTIYITKLGSSPDNDDSKIILTPDYAELEHCSPYKCQIYYYEHKNIINNIPINYTEVKLDSYPKNIPINTYIVEKKWCTNENTWHNRKYYYVDKDVVSTWNLE